MSNPSAPLWVVVTAGLCVPVALATTARGASSWQGTLPTDTLWGPKQSPCTVVDELTAPIGVTLTILPGTTVLFQEGSRMLVCGRLLAEGTPAEPIRITRAGNEGWWLGLQFNGTMEDNRIRHALIEHARTNDGMIGLLESRLLLEYVEFDHCDRRRIRTEDSSLIVRRCRFNDIFGPDERPTTDNMSEHLWGSGIPDGGHLILEENVFGRTKGHNDPLDFDGPAQPKPIPHIRNNLFLGGGDDALDLECDALIEGNVFLNFVKDRHNTAPGEANVLSAGAAKHYTLKNNIFVNAQHIAQVKDGSFVTLINNTAVNISGAAIYFDLDLPYRKPGRGATVENCIFWNVPLPFEGVTQDTELTVNYSLLLEAWHSLGVGNIDDDPLFARVGYWDPNDTPEDTKDDFWIEGDYHLKSQAGRWDPNSRSWVADNVTSRCIDAGNESLEWKNEPWPHGGRINMGAYGGTPEASMSLSLVGSPADLNGDNRIDLRDYTALAAQWLSPEALRKENLSRDAKVDFTDLAAFASWWLWPAKR